MALKSQGVRLVGVAYKEPPADTRGFLARFGDPFATVLVDRQGGAALDWGVSGAPETFLVAANGQGPRQALRRADACGRRILARAHLRPHASLSGALDR